MQHRRHLLFAVLSSAVFATTAFAHSTVKDTVPASGSILTESPPQVVVNFNEPARMTLVVVAAAGKPERKLEFTPASSAASFTIAAPKLETGRSEIKWTALSKDGHPIKGTIILVVKPAQTSAAH